MNWYYSFSPFEPTDIRLLSLVNFRSSSFRISSDVSSSIFYTKNNSFLPSNESSFGIIPFPRTTVDQEIQNGLILKLNVKEKLLKISTLIEVFQKSKIGFEFSRSLIDPSMIHTSAAFSFSPSRAVLNLKTSLQTPFVVTSTIHSFPSSISTDSRRNDRVQFHAGCSFDMTNRDYGIMVAIRFQDV